RVYTVLYVDASRLLCTIHSFRSMLPQPTRSTLFPSRRSSDLEMEAHAMRLVQALEEQADLAAEDMCERNRIVGDHVHLQPALARSEEHTSELQSRENLVCRLLLEKKNEV